MPMSMRSGKAIPDPIVVRNPPRNPPTNPARSPVTPRPRPASPGRSENSGEIIHNPDEPAQVPILGPDRTPASENQPLGSPFEYDQPEDLAPNLAEAIMLMTQELRRRDRPTPFNKTKSKEPDTFDGSDPRKLNSFILQCNLYFRNNSAYSHDSSKVTFALSYLRGVALEHFEPAILDSDDYQDWMEDWSVFISELKTEFGPIDPVNEAAESLDNLRMRDNQKILKYNVEFTRFAKLTRWDEPALRHRYYTGLAERIKDVLSQNPNKPSSLLELRTAAHAIDARYWERSREKSRNAPSTSARSDSKHEKKPFQPTSSSSKPSPPHHQHKTPRPDNKPGTSDRTPRPAFKPLAEKLGKDGKLTQDERKRRFDNNLCMFCGGIGHMAKECPKSNSSAAKARAAKAEEPKK